MTNIPCSSNCVYQHDGYCIYEHVEASEISPDNICAYFKPDTSKNEPPGKESH